MGARHLQRPLSDHRPGVHATFRREPAIRGGRAGKSPERTSRGAHRSIPATIALLVVIFLANDIVSNFNFAGFKNLDDF